MPVNFCPICNSKLRHDRKLPYCSKKCEASVEGYCQEWIREKERIRAAVDGTTAWRPNQLEPIQEINTHNMLVLSDVHCPIHSKEWLYQAIRVAKIMTERSNVQECDVLINGDFIDSTPISSHRGQFWNRRNVLEDDLQAAEAVINLLCKNFRTVYLVTGNHDQRLIKAFGGEVSINRLYKMIGSHDNFKTTGRYFCKVNGHWTFVHPRQYSKIRGKLAQDLSLRHQTNIATGHQHHSSRTISPCGKFQCVDIGALVDLEMQDYCTYDLSSYVAPLNGFAFLQGIHLSLFDKFTNWKAFNLPELGDA